MIYRILTRFNYPKAQVAVFTLAMLLQRAPVIKHVIEFQRALSAPIAQAIRSVGFVATAIGGFQAYSGATTFVINPASPATATVGEEFQMAFTVTGANGGRSSAGSWQVLGDIPEGLAVQGLVGDTMNAEVGIIDGIPTTAGSFSFTVKAFHRANLTGNTAPAVPITILVEGPAFALEPKDTVVKTGGRAQFFVVPSDATASIQWRKDGIALGGQTDATLIIDDVNAADVGTYEAVATVNGSESVSTSATLSIDETATNELFNIATRGYMESGNRVLIGGFVITGNSAKTVLVRAVGPALAEDGVPANEVLADPLLAIVDGASIILVNDNWGSDGNEAELIEAFEQVGARVWDSDSKDAAIIGTFNPGAYTAIINTVDGSSGIALIEAYQLD
ncbi:immunoglobulin domain-containing protein [Puniceicoccaceae bacterium K14]|nr:immunoglobulin domain-containing protein [Puniceicoccaceae bacterium K14]